MTAVAEQEVRGLLAGRSREIAELAGELIRARSENPPGDERAAVAVARAAVERIPGVACRVVAPEPRRESLIAAAGPRGTRTLLLGVHLDTVPAGDGWARDPFGGAIADGAVHGRGASDIKGAAAAMIAALAALAETGVTDRRRVLLVANADEEAGSRLGMDHVRDVLDEPVDAAIVAEPSGVAEPFERLYVASRGAARFSLHATGSSGHTSLVREPGVVNALDVLTDAIARLRERVAVLREPPHPVHGAADLIVVRVEGGHGWGVVPSSARADVEIRVVPGTERAALEAQVADALAGSGVRVEHAPGTLRWVAPSAVDADAPIVRAASRAWASVLGAEPVLGCFPGGTDGRSLTEHGIPTIPGLGPGTLLRAHAPDEHVTVGELVTAAQIYALAAHVFLLDTQGEPHVQHHG